MNIVIVTHNRVDLLRRALDSIVAAERPATYERTIVVENGTRAGAEAVVADFADTLRAEYHYLADRRKTVSLNHALEQIDAGLVVFFDDDIRVEPQTLTTYAEAAVAWPDWYYGGPAIPDYVEPPLDWLRKYLPASAGGLTLPADVGAVACPQTLLGFNWAADRGLIERFGRFREDLGPGTLTGAGDETFLQWAMNDGGHFGKYLQEAKVWHFVPPERCSPEWTLRRSFSGGFNAARADHLKLNGGSVLCGFIGGCFRWVRKWTSRQRLWRALTFRVDGRFWMRFVFHFMTGYVRGWWHVLTTSAPPQHTDPARSGARYPAGQQSPGR